ncbi:hypothetical protein BGW38_008841 [Lunasporangiospora selenospora]|uniref:Uncharacterized protein n=1 Tax=Lunasporangiospora selenospora TaxID=979761 RepID=A0A9P6KGC4_9FUNG|nr:hypothetical protein BGW38_008841 [Lunasporangiospora selenospora]
MTPAMAGLLSSNGCIAIPQEILDPNYKSPTFRIKNWSPPSSTPSTKASSCSSHSASSLSTTPLGSPQVSLESGHGSDGAVEPLSSFRFNFTSQRFHAAVQASLDKSRPSTGPSTAPTTTTTCNSNTAKNRGAGLDSLQSSISTEAVPHPANNHNNSNKTGGLDVQKSAACPELRLSENDHSVPSMSRVVVDNKDKVIEEKECLNAHPPPLPLPHGRSATTPAEIKIESRIRDERGVVAKDDKLRGQNPGTSSTALVNAKKTTAVDVKEPSQPTLASKESMPVEEKIHLCTDSLETPNKESLLAKSSTASLLAHPERDATGVVQKPARQLTPPRSVESSSSLSSLSSSPPSFSKGDIQKSAPVSPFPRSTTSESTLAQSTSSMSPVYKHAPTNATATTTNTTKSNLSSINSPLYKVLSCSALESTTTKSHSTTSTPVSAQSPFLSLPGTKTAPSSPKAPVGLGPIMSLRSYPWDAALGHRVLIR